MTDNGAPVVRRIRNEIQAGTRGPDKVESAKLPYPAARMDNARLTVRARQDDPR